MQQVQIRAKECRDFAFLPQASSSAPLHFSFSNGAVQTDKILQRSLLTAT
jgi:hypothetical protein